METLILSWYILIETGSPFLVSLIAALRFIGTLVGPMFGVVADRVSRRNLMAGMRISFGLFAAVLMVLGLLDILEPWHVFVVATFSGIVRPSEMIVKQSLIADTVPPNVITSALGFARTTMDSARIFGALLGAALLSQLGFGLAYMGVAIFYVFSVALTFGIPNHVPTVVASPQKPWEDLKIGFRYMRATPGIMLLMYLAFLVNLTAFPLTHGLLPVIAKDSFNLDENGLAVMVAVTATGALVGSLIVAVRRARQPATLMLVGILLWHVMIAAFGFVESYVLGLMVLVVIGITHSFGMVTMSALLMTHTPTEFRGRVMGARMLAVYGLPIGLLLDGALIEWFGIGTVLVLNGVIGFLVVLALTRGTKAIRPLNVVSET